MKIKSPNIENPPSLFPPESAPQPEAVSQDKINRIVWKACDTFRGAVDPSEYKNYILTMLFLVYLSHLWKAKREEYLRRYDGDEERVARALRNERFVLPEGCDFDALYAQRLDDRIGGLINGALESIEDANKTKLAGVFRNIDFNSESALGQPLEKNRRLKNLLEDFADPDLNFALTHAQKRDVFGDVYEFLIDKFAADAGKKAGEFYTPKEVSQLLARLVNPQPGDRICDPACGSGSLLIQVAEQVKNPDGTPSHDYALYGQENNGATWALSRMNLFLHEEDAATIKWGDTLNNPQLLEGDRLMKFEVVVANPPFSLDKWGADAALSEAGLDKEKPSSRGFNRFARGVPPKSKADYAFILHMIETATQDGGRVGVIAPHGVLFRGGAEGKIRQALIEENRLDAVIGLPTNLFFGTGIPATILLFKHGRPTTDVLFIDASKDFRDDKKQNKLRPEDIERVVSAYRNYEGIEKYAHRATLEEIRENEWNLNIARYVDTSEAEAPVDVAVLQQEIDDLETQLAHTRAQMDGFLRELGLK